jgi:hypothetical protein
VRGRCFHPIVKEKPTTYKPQVEPNPQVSLKERARREWLNEDYGT